MLDVIQSRMAVVIRHAPSVAPDASSQRHLMSKVWIGHRSSRTVSSEDRTVERMVEGLDQRITSFYGDCYQVYVFSILGLI